MNIKSIVLLIAVLFSAGAFAHGNHGPKGPIVQDQAEAKAVKLINNLVNQNQLEASWQKAKLIEVGKQEKTEGKVWVIQYMNKAESDENNHSLYIVLDDLGNVISATHAEP